MSISNLVKRASGVCAAVAVFAGCSSGGLQSALGPSGQIQQNAAQYDLNAQPLARLLTPSRPTGSMHSDRQRSWMSHDANNSLLLYVSDQQNGVVDVYTNFYGRNALVGQLTGFAAPWGECADKAGDVFIVDYTLQVIVEYAHAGTTPIQTLSDPSGSPIGCSVDPTTGNLAVSNDLGNSFPNPADLLIFQGATGTPTHYADPNVQSFFPPGYDNKGNLFVEGSCVSGCNTELVELPAGSSTFMNISLRPTLYAAAGVQWDGKYLAVGDQAFRGKLTSGIYQVQVSGSTGKVISSMKLASGCSSVHSDVIQFWVQGTTVLGGNGFCHNNFSYWNYPGGGAPRKTMPTQIAPYTPSGETVSR